MGTEREEDRRRAIRRYLSGEKSAAICASMGYSRVWLYKWRKRSQGTTEAWWEEQSRRPRAVPTRTTREIEEIVTVVRLSLYNRDLFCGAQAIRWELEELGVQPRPSLRTIARILARRELTHRRTGRYEPKGKTYPALTIAHPGDVHQTDFVGPCYLTGPVRFYSLHVAFLQLFLLCRPRRRPAGRRSTRIAIASWSSLSEVWQRQGHKRPSALPPQPGHLHPPRSRSPMDSVSVISFSHFSQ